MDAGDLDQRITIEVPSPEQDELGQDAGDWSFVSEPWAKVVETPGREFLSGDYKAESKVVFRIRWRSVNSKARVTWRERVFRISDVTGTQREGWSYLHCIAQDEAN